MSHVRKNIRDNIKDTLTGLATTGKNVFQSRVYPMHGSKLPGILLYNRSEETSYETVATPRMQTRLCEYQVEIYVKATSDYDDTIDQICLEIEEALYVDLTRGDDATDTRITSFNAEFDGSGDQPVAVATLTVEVTYQVRENSPDISI